MPITETAPDGTRCLLALGGNLGSSERLFEWAFQKLESESVRVLAVSRNFETRPVGEQAGGGFLNAAAVVETQGTALQLLELLQRLEADSGRERVIRWGPRTLDLDLLLFGSLVQWQPRLMLPHPAMWHRRFVLSSAVEVAGRMLHPLLGQTVEQLWQRLSEPQLTVTVECAEDVANDGRFAGFLSSPLQLGAVQFLRRGAAASEQSDQHFFARVLLRAATAQNPPWSYPPQCPAPRTIELFVQGPEQALEQMRQTATAITG